jgi:hypothetical protein
MQSRPQIADQRETSTETAPSQAGRHAPRPWPEAIAEAREGLKDLGFVPDKICERVQQFRGRRITGAFDAAVDNLVREPR